jgi:hypothetical protein
MGQSVWQQPIIIIQEAKISPFGNGRASVAGYAALMPIGGKDAYLFLLLPSGRRQRPSRIIDDDHFKGIGRQCLV